jgi:hypothetical protein
MTDSTTTGTDLVAWLREQIGKDELRAKAATSGPWDWNGWHCERPRFTTYMVFRESDEQEVADTRGASWWRREDGDQPEYPANAEHIARWDPDRALREVEAKRRILDAYEQREEEGQHVDVFGYHATGLLLAVRMIAEVYADQPGYREDWRA